MALKIFYMILVAILTTIFVGIGIDTFYSPPKYPEYPYIFEKTPAPENSEETRKAQEEYDKTYREISEKRKVYNRNVSMISLVCALLIMVVSLVLHNKIPVVSDGLLLGSIFIVLYGVIRGFDTDNEKYRFLVTTLSLVFVLGIGFWKFREKFEK